MRSERDKPVRISPSSPDYEEINEIQNKIVLVKNPHMNFGFQEGAMPEAERAACEATLKEKQKELLDFQRLPFNKVLIRKRI